MMTPVKMSVKQKILRRIMRRRDGYRGISRKWWWWSWSRDWPKSNKPINRSRSSQPSPDVIKNNSRLYDERKYAGQYTWFYYNLAKYGYLCKICEVFYSDHAFLTGWGRRAWSHITFYWKTIWKEDSNATKSHSLI